MKRVAIILAVACVAAGCVSSANASLINVDFDGSYTGAAATGLGTDYWNSTSSSGSATGVALKDSLGGATSVSMSYSGAGAYQGNTTSFPFYGGALAGLMDGYLYANPNSGNTNTTSMTVTLSGLAAGTYDLYLYSASDQKGRVLKFAATTTTNTTGGSVTIGPNTDSSGNILSTLAAGKNYGVIEITVVANDILTITSSVVSGESDLCGFQLVSVPEPASAAMLVGGALCLTIFTWRKRRKQRCA